MLPFTRHDLRELVQDEQDGISTARVGLWLTIFLIIITIFTDIWLTVATSMVARVPNTVYAIEGTMISMFAIWAGGARVGQYIGPQLGGIASGIGQAVRSKETVLPNNRIDDERGEHTEREEV